MTLKIIKLFVSLFFRIEINGSYQGGVENGHDKTLIISNHSSSIDGFLLLLFMPVKPVFIVHRESKISYLLRFLFRNIDYLIVDSSKPMEIRKAVRYINNNRPIVIFPEGRVSVTGTLMKIYSGAAFIAMKTQATIIPVYIKGPDYSYFSYLGNLFRIKAFPKLSITIFPPVKLKNKFSSKRTQLEVSKDEMHEIMMKMVVDAKYNGTLFEHLLESKSRHGGDSLLFQDGISEDLTYTGLIRKAVSLSILLKKILCTSKRVGIILPNTNACVVTFYALQHRAKVPVMINYTSGIRAILAGLSATQTKTIITSKIFIKKADLGVIIDNLSEYKIIYLEDLRNNISLSDKANILIKRNFPKLTSIKQCSSSEALALFTSGTEGLPKGVLHSHEGLMTQVSQIKAIYDFNHKDHFMFCLPVFHSFGLTSAFVLPIATGSSGFLYTTPLHYKVIPALIYENNCTILLSTSTFLDGYSRFADQYDFRSLRYVIAGAEKLSTEVIKTYHEKFGIRILEGYGATETAPVISANTTMAYKHGSVGRILPNMDYELIPVPGIDTGGKLVVRGDNVMIGYLFADKPGFINNSPIIDNKKVYDTGDIADIDDDGFIFLKGRLKRFAKLAGEMVSLDSVEKMALNISPDFCHAVISLEDNKKGEVLHLFSTDKEINRKSLQKSAKELGMPKLAIPKNIHYIKEIPIFVSGKTNYNLLKERLL